MSRSTAVIRAIATALVLVLALSVSACGDDDSSDAGSGDGGGAGAIPAKPESRDFAMGIQPWIGYGPWHIAQEEGMFADEGLDVKLTNFTTDDQVNAALASGKLQGANVATHTALKLIEAGLPVKIVLLEDVSTTADAILAGPDVQSIDDLEGKAVAYEEGTTSDILLRYALDQNGMSIDDIERVPLPAADAGSAALAGRVPVAVTYEPYLTTALNEDPDFQLLYTAGEKPGLISDVLVVHEDVIDEKPGQLAALARAWGAAVDFYGENPEEGQTIIAEAVGSSLADLETAFDGVEFFDLAENQTALAGEFANETVVEVGKVATNAGILESEADTSGIIDPRFVEAAGK